MKVIYGLIRSDRFSLCEIARIAGTSLREGDSFIWAKESWHINDVAILERKVTDESGCEWWQLGAVQEEEDKYSFDLIVSIKVDGKTFSVSYDPQDINQIEYVVTPSLSGKEKYSRKSIGLLDVLRPIIK